MTSILTTLGVGSGIDTTALIDALVTADASGKKTALTRKSTDLDARISAMAQIKSATASIASSLAARVTGGNLGVQVTSSDSATLGIASTGDGPVAQFDSTVTVDRLAQGQTLTASRLSSASATVGLGTLTLTTGTRIANSDGSFSFTAGTAPPLTVTMTTANNSLSGLRDAINATNGGVRASIVSDADGATLVLKGVTGAASAFTLTAAPDADAAGLSRFGYSPGTPALTLGQEAQDAQLHVDGVKIRRPSNTVDDVIPGARLALNAAAPTQAVRLTGQRDSTGASSALSDLADALSALRALVSGYRKAASGSDSAGALAGDAGAATLENRLVSLLSTPVKTGGLTLRDVGLSIARDGSIKFDATRLNVLGDSRAADVTALLTGLGKAVAGKTSLLDGLSAIADSATTGYSTRKTAVTTQSTALDAHSTAYRAQLVAQYAAMETAVAASKSVGSFLDDQIKAWQKTGN